MDDPLYQARLQRDLRARKVAPAVEIMLWHYAKGKPVERAEVGRPGDFDISKLSDLELKAELQKMLDKFESG